MKTVVTYELDEEDKRLLRNVGSIPPRPDCDAKCGSGFKGTCCGCPPMIAWERAWKKYEERGLEEIARKLLNAKRIEGRVEIARNNLAKLEQERKELEDFEKSLGL